MSKIRVLPDHLANQIAAGEVVERPASVIKELIENSIDAGASRVEVAVEAGGRRLLRVVDDGSGMTRDDAVLAFERHATSKISTVEDLSHIKTLGFRGEALASIASVARVELVTRTASETEATRVVIEGGRLRDVAPAAHPKGTTFIMRDLFFNVPARRKFLRSEATESYHLTNLVTHYALAHPEIEFALTNNGREVLRASRARDLRERAYQIFGADFVANLLEVNGTLNELVRVTGYTSAPRERRTSTDAQFLFVNGRFVRDKLVRRALGEGYRSVLPHGVYPAAVLFLEVPFDEVDVNVHPAKTEVRFRRAAAIADAVRESIKAALAREGYTNLDRSGVPDAETYDATAARTLNEATVEAAVNRLNPPAQPRIEFHTSPANEVDFNAPAASTSFESSPETHATPTAHTQLADTIAASLNADADFDEPLSAESDTPETESNQLAPHTPHREASSEVFGLESNNQSQRFASETENSHPKSSTTYSADTELTIEDFAVRQRETANSPTLLPPLDSAIKLVREIEPSQLASSNIRPLGQLAESYIIATDEEGLLLIDQHVAHERILFDKYRRREQGRAIESQRLLIPETFDLTPAQAAAFAEVEAELEAHGFALLRFAGRTVAISAVPADLPTGEGRNLLTDILDAVDVEKRGRARANWQDKIAASLACRAAVKINMPLSTEKMQWLIDKLLTTDSPTSCPHGRPVILRLTMKDILKGFHRTG